MSSTFGSFNTVRLGIYAAQKRLDVTGNNITNINTAGIYPPAAGSGQPDHLRLGPVLFPL